MDDDIAVAVMMMVVALAAVVVVVVVEMRRRMIMIGNKFVVVRGYISYKFPDDIFDNGLITSGSYNNENNDIYYPYNLPYDSINISFHDNFSNTNMVRLLYYHVDISPHDAIPINVDVSVVIR
jgi:hypothetical protein